MSARRSAGVGVWMTVFLALMREVASCWMLSSYRKRCEVVTG